MTDKKKLIKFYYLSNVIINTEFAIAFLKHFPNQNISSEEYIALCRSWYNLKSKIDFSLI